MRTGYFRVGTLFVVIMAAAIVAVLIGYASAEAATAQDTLKQPPFAPTDTSLFLPQIYSDAPALQPDSSGPIDEATLSGQLTSLLKERLGFKTKAQKRKVRKAVALFDSASTKQIVPDPHLRATLVALKDTAGEAAIAGVLDGTYSTVRFGTDCPSGAIGCVTSPPNGTREIVFSQRYQFEDFRLLAPTMAHETLHNNSVNSLKVELIANVIDTLIYGQFALETPSLATSGTELARSSNTELMARLNTRDTTGNLRLFTSQGNIFPDGIFQPYFAAPFEPLGDSTPGNKVLKGEIQKVVGPRVALPRNVNFDDNILSLLDTKQRLFTFAELG